MPRRIIGSVAVALVTASFAAPVAQAGSPAKVSVRVEGLTRTLVSTTVTTNRTPVIKDGTNSCTGTSAAGALELATGGKWKASWFDGLGYALDSVDGVKPAGFDYWMLWINGRSSMTGLCDSELQAGDTVLEFICHDAAAPDYSCKNRPLALIGPRGKVQAGTPTAIKVVTLNDDGSTVPASGATVSGGVRSVRADARGRAQVVLPAGQSALQATRDGDVPSAALHCVSGEESATCGSTDRVPPTLAVKGIADGQVFTADDAPRTLHGVARDPEGVNVALRITRRVDGKCTFFHPNRETFRPCSEQPHGRFEVGNKRHWSFLLPSKLGPGSYTLAVRATDQAGNARDVRVRFRVEA
jgi:hypothetical protein